MNDKASITSLMSAFGRAYHAEHEKKPVFCDYRAKELMSETEYDSVKNYILSGAAFFRPNADPSVDPDSLLSDIINSDISATPLCRSAYTETALAEFSAGKTVQYVILGAGLDTFALRNADFLARNEVFEVDHPLTLKDKTARLEKIGSLAKDNPKYVAVDFSKDDLSEKLRESGFNEAVLSFFSWLGVTYYLTESEIKSTLSSISDLCRSGSEIVFDYPDENFPSCAVPRVKRTLMMAAAGGEPMKSFLSAPRVEEILSECGFTVKEHLFPADVQARIIGDKGTNMTAFECVNYVRATKL